MENKIKSFTAALPGWRAVFYDKETNTFIEDAIVGWAVVREGEEDNIVPQVWTEFYLDDPTDTSNFCGILSPNELTPSIDSEAGKRWMERVGG